MPIGAHVERDERSVNVGHIAGFLGTLVRLWGAGGHFRRVVKEYRMTLTTRLSVVAMIGIALLLTGCGAFTGSAEIQQLETQNAQLQGTIQVMGTPALTVAALQQAATQNVVFQAQLTESAVDLLESQSTLTVLELSGGGPVAGSAVVGATPPPAAPPGDQPAAVPTPQLTETPSLTRFSNTVIATDLDVNDCPVGTSSLIDINTDTLYVNTRIDLLLAGSQISARWFANNELFFDDVECWIPNQNYENICAYCSIAPDGETFPVGAWTVELYLDGQLMSQTRFETYDPTAQGEDTAPDTMQ